MKALTVLIPALMYVSVYGQIRTTVMTHSKTGYEGFENFTNETARKLENAINSDKIKRQILDGEFGKTNGLTKQQVYEAIMLAHEIQGDGRQDHVVDLRLRVVSLEKDGKKWMRYCSPGSWAGTYRIDGGGDGINAIRPQRLKIWADSFDYPELANKLMNEYMHILGFEHKKSKKKSLV